MSHYSPRDLAAMMIAVAGVVFLFSDELLDGARSWKHSVRDQIDERMPLDSEIERARCRTAELAAGIVKHREVIVRQSIDVSKLQHEIVEQERHLAENREELLKLRNSLRPVGAVSMPASPGPEVATRLESEFETYRLEETTLDARREILQIRKQALMNAHDSLRLMESQRRQLQIQVENLVSRLELVRTKSGDSQKATEKLEFTECRSQLQRLDSRLRIMEGMLDVDRVIDPSLAIALETNEPNIVERIDEHFGQSASTRNASAPSGGLEASSSPTDHTGPAIEPRSLR